MSLTQYKKKRRFNETPEPAGKEKSSKTHLRFVIQKHDASHVHYDFRLEMEGVLKSWAVPKGPSLNPDDKRLAMMVEDHPYDYRDFEGVIPAGNYGGGTVIVWDEGFYEPLDAAGLSRKEQEKLMMKQLYSGSMKFIMHGQKIKGEYALFQMKGRGERSWILMKKNDRYASEKDITRDERSVKSGKTLVEVAEENGTTVNHPEAHGNGKSRRRSKEPPIQLLDPPARTPSKKSAKAKKTVVQTSTKSAARKPKVSSSASKSSTRKSKTPKSAGKSSGTGSKSAKSRDKSASKKSSTNTKSSLQSVKNLIQSAKSTGKAGLIKKSAMPENITPMLASLVPEPFDNEDWIFEIKWDGYRALAYCKGKNVELFSRNQTSFTETYYPVTEALQALGLKAVLDGEIVAVNDKGLSVFQSLQNWQNTPVHLRYFIFDITWLDGYDLTGLPLIQRKEILKELLPENDEVLQYSDHVAGKGMDFFKAALAQGLEGMMAKKTESKYHPGERTKDWLKVKVNQRQEVVIAGYTKPRNTRKYFGSLLLGVYDGGELVYVGHTGSGFNVKSLEQIYKKMQPLVTEDCPFENCPKGNMPVTWVKPELVCEIKFTEWTQGRNARHPIFMGLREDKKAKDVSFEKAINMATMKPEGKNGKAGGKQKASGKKVQASGKKPQTKSSGSQGKNGGSETEQVVKINGHELKLTNLDKLYWKKEKFSKGDMIRYYREIAPYMLPYMIDRPQSLHRHPNGIDGQSFYQKDMKGKLPDWMQTHEDFSESTNQHVEYLVCSNEATLVYMANLGCIEMHPWHSRTQSWKNPDWCLIDLDPDTKNSFDQVIDVALVVKQILDSIGAQACVKTSGSSGIHIYIPLGAKYDYDQSKQLAELIVNLAHQELPDITSLERSPAKRKGKLYLDFLQNRQTQTAAAPYSLRPKPGVPVSTPLDWSELKKGLTPTTWNALNIFDRLKTEEDLFKPVLGKGIDLEKLLRKLAAQMK